MGKYSTKDLKKVYDDMCGEAIVQCRITRELIGGQPATREGVTAFVLHHLKIAPGPDADAAVARIMNEEIGERDTTPGELADIKERESYGLNVLRRDDYGPWIGDWQIKAAIKQASTGTELFVRLKCKRDVAEMGSVNAWGVSLQPNTEPFHVHLMNPAGDGPAETAYQRFLGRVHTPQGEKSISNDAEFVPIGSRFDFRFQWYDKKITEKDVVAVFSAMQNIGLGSVKSLERGKFDVVDLEVTMKKRSTPTALEDSLTPEEKSELEQIRKKAKVADGQPLQVHSKKSGAVE